MSSEFFYHDNVFLFGQIEKSFDINNYTFEDIYIKFKKPELVEIS